MTSTSASASSIVYSSGVSSPLEIDDSTHYGALIAISATVGLCLILVSLPIRIWVRLGSLFYKSDDYSFLASSLFSLLQATTVYIALHRGFGTSGVLIPQEKIPSILKALYASDIFFVAALFFSKLSTAFLILRLTPGRGHFIAVWSAISLVGAWCLASLIILGIRCHPLQPWIDVLSASACSSLFLRWQVITALDIITELVLFAIAIYLVWNLRMQLGNKAKVVGAFGCRIPLIILAAFRLRSLSQTLYSSDPTFTGAMTSCITSFEIGYSIFASIIPCLKPFMTAYEGPQEVDTSKNNYDISNNSYKLSSMSRKRNDTADGGINVQTVDGIVRGGEEVEVGGDNGLGGIGKKLKLRPDKGTEYQAKVNCKGRSSEKDENGSFDSGESTRMIIQKNIEWSVDYRKDSNAGSGK
ncbi:hypothetical protein BP6252_00032 [Coleophoma cylindrospora]|uniref:Rhodopsin domain-containing protein n=1 Tax=Coleophoma cylindrospora TaxID=1849047 RepID=A0A3D8SNW0_9HELO|nr:hypothetical protein BP6252_00032 [Coleophoma cylindrospora]